MAAHPIWECKLRYEAAGFREATCDVVRQVPEAQSRSAEVLVPAVDGRCPSSDSAAGLRPRRPATRPRRFHFGVLVIGERDRQPGLLLSVARQSPVCGIWRIR